ncbi:MAG: hypothetical protein Q8Q30_01505 [Candidatus Woesebacteria bacterium]|nr:hypothetical protein [Candidatus Woesebacteria bacterium]
MVERRLIIKSSDFISCDVPCDELYARIVAGSKVKGVATTDSKRCIAQGAALRGQHHNLQTGHADNLPACRVCIVYTAIDKPTSPV